MTFAKTSIFFFCLILGTSVFPSGSSTGIASAKPIAPLAILSGIEIASSVIGNIMPGFGKQPGSNSNAARYYGSLTNQQGASFQNANVGGSLSFGSSSVQDNNNFSE